MMKFSAVTFSSLTVAALLVLAGPARSDDLDPARAKLAEMRATRSAHDAGAAPAPVAAPAPAPAAEAPAKAEKAPAAAPAAKVDPRESTGPGRPEFKPAGSFPFLADPFMHQKYRVIIEEHAYKVGDRIKGAKIVKITAADVTFTKDGDTWTIPSFTK